MVLSKSMDGVVTIVQESRFQLVDDGGVAHMFILGRNAAAEPSQLWPLQHAQTRVRVRYKPAANLVGHVAASIAVLD